MRAVAFTAILLLLLLGNLDACHALILMKSEKWIVCTEHSVLATGLECAEPRKTKVWRDDCHPEWVPDEPCSRDHSLLRYIVEDMSLILPILKLEQKNYMLFESLEQAQSWCRRNCTRKRR